MQKCIVIFERPRELFHRHHHFNTMKEAYAYIKEHNGEHMRSRFLNNCVVIYAKDKRLLDW